MSFNLNEYCRQALKQKPTLDSCSEEKKEKDEAVLDDAIGTYAYQDIALKSGAIIQAWAETDDLGDGEGYADRLLALFVGLVDADKDGDISDDESALIDVALNSAWDYLELKKIPEADIDALLNEWNEEAAERIHDLLASELPDGDAAYQDLNSFVFAAPPSEPLYDSVMDAVYRNQIVVRKGKKVRIRKRVSGKVRLTGRQRMAIRKAQRKSHSASANLSRLRSFKVRSRSHL